MGGGWALLERLGARCCCAMKTLLALRSAVLSVSYTSATLFFVHAMPVLPLSSISDLLV